VEACLAGAGNTGRVTQQADRTELYWGRRDEDVVQGQDLNYRTRRRMPLYVRCDLCDDVIRRQPYTKVAQPTLISNKPV